MNVDFFTLSSAVQQANHVEQDATADAPRKLPARRRSSYKSSNAQQFLEAAHRSWNFDLSGRETTALMRRKSKSRYSKEALADVGHNSWTFGESRNETPLLKVESSKMLPPRSKTLPAPRRASIAGSVMASPIIEEEEEEEDDEAEEEQVVRKGGRLARRNNLQAASSEEKNKIHSEDCNSMRSGRMRRRSSLQNKSEKPEDKSNSIPSVRRVRSDPKPEARTKIARRSTISHCYSMDDSSGSLTKSPKQTQKDNSSRNNTQSPKKGSVRFELDHKNRIKRRVIVIRAQNSKTDAKILWWSENELDRIYDRENKVYEKFADSRSYTRKVRQLWGNCSKASGSKKSSKPSSLSPQTIAHVAGSPCRGLEVDILETVRDRRARVIGSLLDAQETLRDFDPSIRTKVLSARYKNLCKAACKFARKMGEGDALEAANVYST